MADQKNRRYWLVKSEPDVFSWEDLWKATRRTTFWDGVRNYQARNFMRDDMALDDGVLYYHSRCKEPSIVGIARVSKAGSPDPTQFDPADSHFDPKAKKEDPRWIGVHIQALGPLPNTLTLQELKTVKKLVEMPLLQRGQRLSVQPVSPAQWREVLRLGGYKGKGA